MIDLTSVVALLAGVLSMAVVIGAVIRSRSQSPVTVASMLYDQK